MAPNNVLLVGAALALGLVASVNAACDNACSGHGICTYHDECKCWDNWRMGNEEGGDCSDRVCPFDIAWADNADGSGRSHKYAECSGRGLCDRSSGLCSCFEGFEGKSCQRTTCPNDCSGHGRCMFLNELPVGSVWSDRVSDDVDARASAPGSSMKYWDAEKTRGCVCDATYYGVDCSMRLCPRGTDILDLKRSVYEVDLQVPQIQRLKLIPFNGMSVDGAFGGNTFSLVFKSLLNETFATAPIYFPASITDTVYGNSGADPLYDDYNQVTLVGAGTTVEKVIVNKIATVDAVNSHSVFAEAIEDALVALPNQVIDDVYVSVSKRYYTTAIDATDNFNTTLQEYFNIDVEFRGTAVQGPQNLLMVQADSCGVGCTPQLTGIHLQEYVVTDSTALGATGVAELWSDIDQLQSSDFNSYECGRRGKCDYTTGICGCFTGYTGESCNVQTALV